MALARAVTFEGVDSTRMAELARAHHLKVVLGTLPPIGDGKKAADEKKPAAAGTVEAGWWRVDGNGRETRRYPVRVKANGVREVAAFERERVLDPASGRPLNANLADYRVATARDTPPVVVPARRGGSVGAVRTVPPDGTGGSGEEPRSVGWRGRARPPPGRSRAQ